MANNVNFLKPHTVDYSATGRKELEELCKEYLANLTSVQTRCTELLEENRELRALIDKHGLVLP